MNADGEWTSEGQAEFEQFAASIGKPNTPEVEEFLAFTNDEFFDLQYDPGDFGETPPSVWKRLLWVFSRLRWAPWDFPTEFFRQQ